MVLPSSLPMLLLLGCFLTIVMVRAYTFSSLLSWHQRTCKLVQARSFSTKGIIQLAKEGPFRRICPFRSPCHGQFDLISATATSCRFSARFFSSASTDSTAEEAASRERQQQAKEDVFYLQQAIDHARHGLGHTYPNPAVGCVIVVQTTSSQVGYGASSVASSSRLAGAGFHPRAGYPHAEIFALLQAFRHVPDGVQAALSIVNHSSRRLQHVTSANDGKSGGDRLHRRRDGTTKLPREQGDRDPSAQLRATVNDLTAQYIQEGGAQALFGDKRIIFEDGESPGPDDYDCDDRNSPSSRVTAYVTLEPCCHVGKATPPCALTLVTAGVDRVVIGFRDPNPRVDGGGVRFLQDRGIRVEFCPDPDLARQCESLVRNFCKRIAPPFPTYLHVTGAMGSALRTLAAQRKQARSLAEISWGGDALSLPDGADGDDAAPRDDSEARMTERINELALEPEWMEHLDGFLWQQELVLMRLNQAIPKKRYVKRLGERIADVLQAHVVQNAGHTVLLYRPGKPPILNLERLVANKRQGEGDGKWAH